MIETRGQVCLQVETRLTKQVQAGQMRIATLEASLADTQQTLADATTELLAAQSVLRDKEREAEAAAARAAELEGELAAAQEQSASLAEQVATLREARLELLAEKHNLQQEVERVQVCALALSDELHSRPRASLQQRYLLDGNVSSTPVGQSLSKEIGCLISGSDVLATYVL